MAWRVAKACLRLRAQIDTYAPGRSRASDGTIGDTAHENTKSDHNPRVIPGLGTIPVVTAIDITHDPAHGVDCGQIAEGLRRSRDPRIKYVIFGRRIFSSMVQPWVWRDYSGDNPHTKHLHLSVMGTTLADQETDWSIPMALTADERRLLEEAREFARWTKEKVEWNIAGWLLQAIRNTERIEGSTTQLLARPPVEPAPVDMAALVPVLGELAERAAERAVRKVLGSLDNPPASPVTEQPESSPSPEGSATT